MLGFSDQKRTFVMLPRPVLLASAAGGLGKGGASPARGSDHVPAARQPKIRVPRAHESKRAPARTPFVRGAGTTSRG